MIFISSSSPGLGPLRALRVRLLYCLLRQQSQCEELRHHGSHRCLLSSHLHLSGLLQSHHLLGLQVQTQANGTSRQFIFQNGISHQKYLDNCFHDNTRRRDHFSVLTKMMMTSRKDLVQLKEKNEKIRIVNSARFREC